MLVAFNNSGLGEAKQDLLTEGPARARNSFKADALPLGTGLATSGFIEFLSSSNPFSVTSASSDDPTGPREVIKARRRNP